ncbi:MAG: hypothetical protein AAF088_09850 [Pseudomonadota bacterium]
MKQYIAKFSSDEAGAVTVDWVVLSAAVVGLAATIFSSILNGSTSLAVLIQNFLAAFTVG